MNLIFSQNHAVRIRPLEIYQTFPAAYWQTGLVKLNMLRG